MRVMILLHCAHIITPLGEMLGYADQAGICLLEFSDHTPKKRAFKPEIISGTHSHLDQLNNELQEYFARKRKTFDVKLNPLGTSFQQSVWNILKTIPYGQTYSYQQQAHQLNHPKAIRAVANANGCNPLSILIPCHRVIGSNGHLTGYAGGLKRKQWLLDLEKNHVKN